MTYTSAPGFVGTDVIGYVAEDDTYFQSSEERAMTITVSAPPQVAPPPPPPPVAGSGAQPVVDTLAPRFSLRARRVTPRAAARDGLVVVVDAQEAGTAVVTLRVGRAAARRLGLRRKPSGPVVIGTLSAAVSGRAELTVRMSAKARKALKGARRARILVTVVLTDATGNRAVKTGRVTLKR